MRRLLGTLIVLAGFADLSLAAPRISNVVSTDFGPVTVTIDDAQAPPTTAVANIPDAKPGGTTVTMTRVNSLVTGNGTVMVYCAPASSLTYCLDNQTLKHFGPWYWHRVIGSIPQTGNWIMEWTGP